MHAESTWFKIFDDWEGYGWDHNVKEKRLHRVVHPEALPTIKVLLDKWERQKQGANG